MSDVKYLIFDIETVGDGDLIRKVRFPDEDLTPREAVERYRRQLLEETGKDVLPLTFVLPVSVAIAKVAADYRLLELIVLDSPEFRPQEIVRRFWQGWQHYQRPTLVTFNGRSYDMPVMEVSAFRFGLSIPAWFNVDSRAFEQSRNRYNHDSHLDLQELLTNFGSFRMHGGLNLLAQLIDKPGTGFQNGMVHLTPVGVELAGELGGVSVLGDGRIPADVRHQHGHHQPLGLTDAAAVGPQFLGQTRGQQA